VFVLRGFAFVGTINESRFFFPFDQSLQLIGHAVGLDSPTFPILPILTSIPTRSSEPQFLLDNGRSGRTARERGRHWQDASGTQTEHGKDDDAMEISTILGLIVGFFAMAGVLLFGKANVSIAEFIDPPAILMVFGGATAVALVGYPLKQVINLAAILKKPFFTKPTNPAELIDELVELAEIARRDGLLALEVRTKDLRDPFIATGIQLSVDGTRSEILQEIMRSEIAALETRHREAKKILDLIGRCGPAFGMIATLLGLILMLGNLDNPSTVGPSMAVALIGTLYGAVLANLICIPLGEKLAYLSSEEVLLKQIAMKGILAIQAGDNPRIVRQKLDVFIPLRQRLSFRSAES
jgi:chemotaxis protein MotA